jgi:hypothetical protein
LSIDKQKNGVLFASITAVEKMLVETPLQRRKEKAATAR